LAACRCCDEILRRERDTPAAREARACYSRCLRRLHLVSRHADSVYKQTLEKLTPSQALDAYEQVISLLSAAYPDREKTNLTLLFHQGLQELSFALQEPSFLRQHLPNARPAAVKAFLTRLASWPVRKMTKRYEAREQVRAVIRSALREGLPVRPRTACVFALEFAAGACNTLDDYSSLLTPGNLALVQAPPRETRVGVGLELGAAEGGVQVTRVYPNGPAAEAGLKKNDRLLRIGAAGKPLGNLPEAAAEKLRGKPGSSVEVEVQSADPMQGRRTVKLVRRAVTVPSVEFELVNLDPATTAGYLRINYFSDSTVQDIREAIAGLSAERPPVDLKGLIIDLRGNPGGLFKAAVSVAELFLTEGVIVISQSPYPEYNGPFKVETSGPFQFPVVVLIDSETASAAEVLAGALKEGRPDRAPTTVLGQTSYGKGSIQCIFPLEKSPLDRPTGVRLTIAKLFSPSNQPYTGRGVVPHKSSRLQGDKLLTEAHKELLRLIEQPPTMSPKMPMPVGETSS
jgi:carboxyl-terminal processing protease